MSSERVLSSTAVAVAEALAPLAQSLQSSDVFADLVARLGWAASSSIDMETVRAALVPLPDDLDRLEAAAAAVIALPADAEPHEVAGPLATLIGAIQSVVTDLRALMSRPPSSAWPSPLDDIAFWQSFPAAVVEVLIYEALEQHVPRLFGVLHLLGVLAEEAAPAPSGGRAFVRKRVVWTALQGLVGDPAGFLASTYRWRANFDFLRLLRAVERLAAGFSIPTRLAQPSSTSLDHYWDTTASVRKDILELDVPLLWQVVSVGPSLGLLAVDVVALPIPPEGDRLAAPNGIAVMPKVVGQAGATVKPAPNVELVLSGGFESSGGIRLEIRSTGARVAVPPDLGLTLSASTRLQSTLPAPLVLLGVATSTRIEVQRWHVAVSCRGPLDGVEVVFEAALDEAAFVLDLGEGDGFIQSLVGATPIHVDLSSTISWSSRDGLRFSGQPGLELDLPTHQSIAGVLELQSVAVRAGASGTNGAELVVSASGRLALGPVTLSLDRVGLKASLEPRPPTAAAPGNLGPVDLDFGFKPPDGLALSIDAGAVTGGGFLFFDPVKEQYAGALHLEVEGGLALNAFGLLTTRMPDGSPGFSLLIMVQASGFAPVPLGFGFTLTGVGGLLGVNRSVDVEVLRTGLRNRTLDAILFSQEEPTPRAPQIVSTLQSVFPPAPDQYVFGPLVQIVWGPPPNPLLTIEVALVLELPAPLRLIILGRVQASLPTPTHPAVKLRLDVVGVIDFDRRHLAVDATLYDSFVGPFALTGDMAARGSWGDQPDFAVALGGFHPAFRPPEGFPELRRLALTLSSGDNPRLRMEAYLALTSNTVQIGARLDFYVAAAGFSLEGGFGFDTLITLSPFRLQAQIDAGLTLKQGSTTLAHLGVHVNLVGPTPWEVWGTATITILLLDISVPFHATFGEPQALPEPEQVDVWVLLKGQLAHPRNWSTALPPEDNRLVTLVALPGQGDALVHPLGAVSVTQRLVPLERTLSLFGTAPPAEADYFEITGGTALVQGDDISDYFAPAQFRRMSDAEKLSSPSFDRMVSGATFGPRADEVAIGTVAVAPLAYETARVVDLNDPTPQRSETYRPLGDTVATLTERGPAALATLRDQGREKFAPPAPGPALAESEYVVATRDTLAAEVDTHDGTYSGAVEALRLRPDAERFQIVRREEVELAAL